MKKDLILFETAKLAKEKGFDELVLYKYSDKGVLYISYTTEQYYGIETLKDFISSGDGFTKNNELPWNDIYRSKNENKKVNIVVTAPTQSELQKWLRENHLLLVDVFDTTILNDDNETFSIKEARFSYCVNQIPTAYHDDVSNDIKYNTYEEALEKGLQEALKLIS